MLKLSKENSVRLFGRVLAISGGYWLADLWSQYHDWRIPAAALTIAMGALIFGAEG